MPSWNDTAMPDGVLDVLPDEAEAVHGGVWHAVHGYDVVREIGFERTGFFYGERSGFDPALVAGRDPRSFKLGPVFGRADEEAFGSVSYTHLTLPTIA